MSIFMNDIAKNVMKNGLGPWIDISTGKFHRIGNARKSAEQELAEQLWGVVKEIFCEVHERQLGDEYKSPSIGVAIRFSDDIKWSAKKMHHGIGGAECSEAENRDIPESSDEGIMPDSRDQVIEVRSLILGRFSPSASRDINDIGTIWLYTRAIAEFSNNNAIEYKTVFFAILAREAFHALHYSLFKEAGVRARWNAGTRLYRDIVKESLASSNEYVFLMDHQGSGLDSGSSHKLMDRLEYEWGSYDIDDHPSSGALLTSPIGSDILRGGNLSGTLLRRSLYDWKTAADIIRTGYYLACPTIKDPLQMYSRFY